MAKISSLDWQFSKCCPGTLGHTRDLFRGLSASANYFYYSTAVGFDFFNAHSHEYTVEFSGGYMTCDITKDENQKQIQVSICLQLSQIIKSFAKT